MKTRFDSSSRKRPVNLTLSESLVSEAKLMTDNLSGVVETLLAEFVHREREAQLKKSQAVNATVAAWNSFNSRSGSIADEYSPL